MFFQFDVKGHFVCCVKKKRYHVSCRNKNLVIPREDIAEDAVATNIRNEESTNEREVKTFACSVCLQAVPLTKSGVQRYINYRYHHSRYLTVTTYRGHQFVITDTSLNAHSTAPISRPEDCLCTCITTASGTAGGVDGPLARYHALHRDSG